MATEAVTCPLCNATYPEGEPHACVPQPDASRWSTVRWSFQLATGVAIGLAGGFAARLWHTLAGQGYGHSPVAWAVSVFTIVCLGSGLWIVVGCLAQPPE